MLTNNTPYPHTLHVVRWLALPFLIQEIKVKNKVTELEARNVHNRTFSAMIRNRLNRISTYIVKEDIEH